MPAVCCRGDHAGADARPCRRGRLRGRESQRAAGCSERGLSGVAVSNQREVVQTGADGSYSLPRPRYGIVFVSLTDGYAAIGNFWRSVSPSSNSPVDFALTGAPGFQDVHLHPRLRHARQRADSRSVAAAPGDRRKKPSGFRAGDGGPGPRRASCRGGRSARVLRSLHTGGSPLFDARLERPGNHEIFGIERHLSLVSPKHPLYGKGM